MYNIKHVLTLIVNTLQDQLNLEDAERTRARPKSCLQPRSCGRACFSFSAPNEEGGGAPSRGPQRPRGYERKGVEAKGVDNLYNIDSGVESHICCAQLESRVRTLRTENCGRILRYISTTYIT